MSVTANSESVNSSSEVKKLIEDMPREVEGIGRRLWNSSLRITHMCMCVCSAGSPDGATDRESQRYQSVSALVKTVHYEEAAPWQ